jgi:hypothetical protein
MSIEAAPVARGPIPRAKITKAAGRWPAAGPDDLGQEPSRIRRSAAEARPSFVLKYSFRRHQRYYTIGRYGILTVDEARNEARAARTRRVWRRPLTDAHDRSACGGSPHSRATLRPVPLPRAFVQARQEGVELDHRPLEYPSARRSAHRVTARGERIRG